MTEQERQRAIRLRLSRGDPRALTYLATGFTPVDAALGLGGLPRGLITELFGGSGSGKTTLALQIVAHVQEAGASAAWIDAEHSFDPAYAATLGVTIDGLPLSQPESAEQALEIARRLALSGAVDLLVVDSAAALAPQLELETGLGDGGHGLQSRALASGLRRLALSIRGSATAVLFLNQTRTRNESAGGLSETSAGGPPLKLYAAVRIALGAVAGHAGAGVPANASGRAASGFTRFRILKNRTGAAFAEGQLRRQTGIGFLKSP